MCREKEEKINVLASGGVNSRCGVLDREYSFLPQAIVIQKLILMTNNGLSAAGSLQGELLTVFL